MTNQFKKPLKFLIPTALKFKIVLVGCGGTGSFIAQDIARLAYHLKDRDCIESISFIDYDSVEYKNVGRQNFVENEIGKKKALCLAARYNISYGLNIAAHPMPATEVELFQKNDANCCYIVIGGVDNTAARAFLAKTLKKIGYYQRDSDCLYFWLDCGNERASGQILIGNETKLWDGAQKAQKLAKMGLVNAIPYPHIQHPELIKKKPKPKLSCAELAAAQEQSLMVNRAMSIIAGQYLYEMLIKREIRQYATYISLSGKAVETKYINENIWQEIPKKD